LAWFWRRNAFTFRFAKQSPSLLAKMSAGWAEAAGARMIKPMTANNRADAPAPRTWIAPATDALTELISASVTVSRRSFGRNVPTMVITYPIGLGLPMPSAGTSPMFGVFVSRHVGVGER